MKRFDAVGFGALNMDKLFSVNEIAAAEGESFIRDFAEVPGGSAANAMVGLSRLGCKVGFIGKVACDPEGRKLLEDFRKENVDVNGIIVAEQGRTGTVMGFVNGRGERALYADAGVNSTITLAEQKKEYASEVCFLHLTSFVGEESFHAQVQLAKALPRSVKLSFDPGALYARRRRVQLRPILKRTFVSMPNALELELMTGRTGYKEGAEALLREGMEIVAVKLGKKGCYVTDGTEKHLIPALKVKTVDTTGAGDAFCAGFLYGLISNKTLEECGRIGNFLGSRCVMKIGARTGLPTLEDLRAQFTGSLFKK